MPGHALAARLRSPRTRADHRTAFALAATEAFVGVNALGGAVYLLGGAEGFPPEWLERLPFPSYVIPGLTLSVVVGGSMFAAAWSVARRHRFASAASVGAAAVLLAWLTTQVAMLGYISWLQPAFAALALIVATLARRIRP